MQLGRLTHPDLIFPDLGAPDGESVLRQVAERLAEKAFVASGSELFQKLSEREELESTGIGSGVAIPHCKFEGLDEVLVAIATLQQGIDFKASDGEPVSVFFFIVSPTHSPAAHLQSLASISRWVMLPQRVHRLLDLDSAPAIYDYLLESDT